MSAVAERILRVLEELANSPEGKTLSELSTSLDLPITATHRLLADLMEQDYVRKDERRGEFTLTMKMPSLGLRFLSAGGVVDIAQPILERLASTSGELVRLAIVDGEQLIYVAKAQGARQGIRYDPEMGRPVTLSCSAAGMIWLAGKSDEEVMRLVSKQGFGVPSDFGPHAPTTFKALIPHIDAARANGYATTHDMFLPAMSSMATTVHAENGEVRAILIIAGPMSRLTDAKMKELVPSLMSTSKELSEASGVSPMLRQAMKGPNFAVSIAS
ncbi:MULTISPECIES: IclR family transcriptional regulator [unclassified Caballeronia]|uniref:IclR family transcriptional regulator n=1 Tax=unclassified Caballeronia TaxID=2646786 RepID=UPI00286A03A2|nr:MULTISPECIES: IclR family transcriptional regulator [unclassified Caballeronia]